MKTVKFIIFVLASVLTVFITYLMYLSSLEQGGKTYSSLLFAVIEGCLMEFIVILALYGLYFIKNWNK